jgi:hypothetical protein
VLAPLTTAFATSFLATVVPRRALVHVDGAGQVGLDVVGELVWVWGLPFISRLFLLLVLFGHIAFLGCVAVDLGLHGHDLLILLARCVPQLLHDQLLVARAHLVHE